MTKFLVLSLSLLSLSANSAYLVKKTIKNNKENIISVKEIDLKIRKIKVLKSIRESISEKVKTENTIYKEILYPKNLLPKSLETKLIPKNQKTFWAGSEVRKISGSTKDTNRITITILGDGYTEAEKNKYFDDVNRIVDDMFKEVTFKSYLPLFNIYAVFTPSAESGITDLQTKRTAFDLYRSPRGSKRGVMPGNRSAIERALELVDVHTDYPIIIANDDFYGGLGGRYAITTRSLTSGSMVLRHELGHNFSNVGEEYDGGQVYSGANFSRSTDVPWKHWNNYDGGKIHVHKAEFLTGAYIWQDLGLKDYSVKFNFPYKSGYSYDLKISSVGWETEQDVKVELDGKELELDGVFTSDRSFFRTKKVAIHDGEHLLTIKDHARDGNNVLAYANGYAYPDSYDFTYGKVGAFNVFDENQNERGYRPTHNQCLMRDMRSKIFCPVDQESIWLRFLGRISLIDSVKENNKVYSIETLPVGVQTIKWFEIERRNRVELVQFRDKKIADFSNINRGKFEVEVSMKHPEIRIETEETTDIYEFKIR